MTKTIKILTFCSIILLQTSLLFSQQILHWTNYLEYSRVLCMIDLDTAVLTGTSNGLTSINKWSNQPYYFNGSNSGMPGYGAKCLARDAYGNIWIGTGCGLTKYSGGNWINYTPQNSILITTVTALHYSPLQDFLCVGQADGTVLKIDTSGWTQIQGSNGIIPMSEITSLVTDSIGNLWAGTLSYGLYKWDGLNWQVFNTTNSPVLNSVVSLAVDYNGLLWVANSMKLTSFNGISWVSHIGPTIGTTYISVDTSNTVWISTFTNGLYTWNGTFNHLSINPQLTSTQLFSHFWDKSNIWTGTYSNGVDKINGNLVTNIPLRPGIPDPMIVDIDFDSLNNTAWFAVPKNAHTGSGGVFFSYNGSSWQLYDSLNAVLMTNNISSIQVDDNSFLWIGSVDSGLYCKQGNNLIHYTVSNSNIYADAVTSISKNLNNQLLIGFRDGVVQSLQNNNFNILIPPNTINSMITKIKPDSSPVVWIASDSSGLIKYNLVNTIIYNTSNSGLPSNHIMDIEIDAFHNLWLATNAGLVKFDGNSSWNLYTSSNSGLPENDVVSISIAKDSSIWVGTENSGFATFDGLNWTTYDACNSPLPCNSITTINTSPTGKIFIGTCGGVCVIEIDNITGQPIFTEESSVKVYPNPGSNKINFDFNLPRYSRGIFQIVNTLGNVLVSKQINLHNQDNISFSWDLNNASLKVPDGIYFYTLNGNFISCSGKVVVQH